MKKMFITGHVGHTPSIRTTQDGSTYATFSVGVSVGSKLNPKTDWVDISCNGKLVGIVQQFVTKGSKLLCEGFPATSAYMGKDGQPKASLKLLLHNVELLGGGNQDNPQAEQQDSSKTDVDMANQQLDDNIPF